MTAKLQLSFERAAQQEATILSIPVQQPPWKVVRAFPVSDGSALVHIHNVSGGVLGGDELELDIHVAVAARAQLTSTGATRLYCHRAGLPAARQSVRINVDENGLLEYLPDALIPYAGSRYRQSTSIYLGRCATLFWWEILAPGRLASGEIFAFDSLDLESAIEVADRPILKERWRLEPAVRPLTSMARFGAYTHLASFYACQEGRLKTEWMELERLLSELAGRLSEPDRILWGVSALAAGGVAVRGLSTTGKEVLAGLQEFWRAAKLSLTGREAIRPRKIY